MRAELWLCATARLISVHYFSQVIGGFWHIPILSHLGSNPAFAESNRLLHWPGAQAPYIWMWLNKVSGHLDFLVRSTQTPCMDWPRVCFWVTNLFKFWNQIWRKGLTEGSSVAFATSRNETHSAAFLNFWMPASSLVITQEAWRSQNSLGSFPGKTLVNGKSLWVWRFGLFFYFLLFSWDAWDNTLHWL